MTNGLQHKTNKKQGKKQHYCFTDF